MFKTKFKSLSTKITVIISIILLITFTSVLSYYNISLKKGINFQSEQLLLNIAMQYQAALNSEIDKIQTASNILSVNISKNFDNKNFTNQISGDFMSFINRNSKIYNISLITNQIIDTPDSLLISKSITDSVFYYKISFSKKEKGIIKDKKNIKINDIQNQFLINKSIEKNKNAVLNPEFINDKLILIPIIQPIYKGNRYIGYLRIFVDIKWLYNNNFNYYKIQKENFEISISSKNEKIFFTNKQKHLLGRNMRTEYSGCNSLLNTSVYGSKVIVKDRKLTLCKPISFDNNKTKWNIRLSIKKNKIYQALGYNFYTHLAIGLILLIITIVIIAYLINRTIKPLKMLISFAEKVSVGDFECVEEGKEIERKDEIGQLQKAFKAISISLIEITDITKSIASGEFNKKIKIRSKKDTLAESINQMTQALKKAKEEENKRIEENNYSRWFTEGLNEINKVLKIHHKDIYELTENVTKAVVNFFNIALGGIFITTEDENNEIILELIAAYAYSESKFIKKTFKIGESLVGACASEKRIVNIKKLPKGYLQALSGLGESSPKHLLIMPLLYEKELMGVLELASLNLISNDEIKLLESIADNIASNLSIAKANLHTQELLKQSQQYAKELADKDKKMDTTMSQLQDLQEKTAKSEASVKAKLNAMNNTLMTVEYTIDGILLDANQKYLSTMNYSYDEIKGVNVLELLKDEDRDELLRVIEIVKNGNFYESIMRRHTKEGREKWILATYTPIKNEEGGVEKILFYGADITRIKEKENSVKKELERLKTQLPKQ